MNLSSEDKLLLEELCQQNSVSSEKVLKLLDAVRDYEFKDRRTGVYDALREILKTKPTLKPAMTEDIQAHLKAIQAWLDHVDQMPLPAPPAKGLSSEEKQQLQVVNKAVEQLTKLGVEIPSDLRSLKLRLSANDVASVSNPQITMHLTGVESLIDGLRELSQAARALREKLKTGAIVSGAKKHYGVALEELLDAGLLSTDDRLELQWTRGSGVFEGKVLGDGTVSAKSAGGWKQYDSLSTAASEIAGRPLNGWDCWRRTNADGKRTSLKEIRAEYLNQENDS